MILRRENFESRLPFSVITTHYDHVELAGDAANEKSGVPIVLKLAEMMNDPQYIFLIADREEPNKTTTYEKISNIIKPLQETVDKEYIAVYNTGGKVDWSHWCNDDEDWMDRWREISGCYYGLGDKFFLESLGDLIEGINLVVNVDSVGGKGGYKINVCSVNKDLGEKMKCALRENGILTFNNSYNDIVSQWQQYIDKDIKNCVLIIDELGQKGYKWHHTQEDTFDKIDIIKCENILNSIRKFLIDINR